MDTYFNVSDASAVQKTQNINFLRTWTFTYDPVLKESDQNSTGYSGLWQCTDMQCFNT